MKSYCTYAGNCINLGLSSLFLTMIDGSQFEIVKSQYLKQRNEPSFECEILIHGLPQRYLGDLRGLDLLIG